MFSDSSSRSPISCTRPSRRKSRCVATRSRSSRGDLKSPPSAPAHRQRRAQSTRAEIAPRHRVETCHRLVEDQQLWTVHQREHDGQALPSPVRVCRREDQAPQSVATNLAPGSQRSLGYIGPSSETCHVRAATRTAPESGRRSQDCLSSHCRDQDSDSPARGTVLKSVRSSPADNAAVMSCLLRCAPPVPAPIRLLAPLKVTLSSTVRVPYRKVVDRLPLSLASYPQVSVFDEHRRSFIHPKSPARRWRTPVASERVFAGMRR